MHAPTAPPPLDLDLAARPWSTPGEAIRHFDAWVRIERRRTGRERLTQRERRNVKRTRENYVRRCVNLARNPRTLALLRRQAEAAARITLGEPVPMPKPVARPGVPASGRAHRPSPRRRRSVSRSSSRSADPGDESGEPAPAWRCRVAAQLSLRAADFAGYEALTVAVRHDGARRGWWS